MHLDGDLRQPEPRGHLLVRVAVRQQRRDFLLARCHRMRSIFPDRQGARGPHPLRLHPGPRQNLLHDFLQQVERHALGDDGDGSGAQRGVDGLALFGGGDDDDGRRAGAPGQGDRVDTGHARQAEVQEHQVGRPC